ncbi:hypothetical protein SLE2022_266740 [Rubroshorea leprosula]
MPNPCDVICNFSLCYMHSGDHFDVHLLMTSVSLHPKVNAGFLTPGLMGLYVLFLCWCAIRSEPVEQRCNRKAEASDGKDWLTIISFVVALLSIVIATFSTGIDSQSFQFRKKDTPTEDGVPYGYGFFHFVFATGAMYFAMLLIGWNTHHTIKKWTIDVGWTSAWVRIVNEWLAVCVYIWMVLAPIILKSTQTICKGKTYFHTSFAASSKSNCGVHTLTKRKMVFMPNSIG